MIFFQWGLEKEEKDKAQGDESQLIRIKMNNSPYGKIYGRCGKGSHTRRNIIFKKRWSVMVGIIILIFLI